MLLYGWHSKSLDWRKEIYHHPISTATYGRSILEQFREALSNTTTSNPMSIGYSMDNLSIKYEKPMHAQYVNSYRRIMNMESEDDRDKGKINAFLDSIETPGIFSGVINGRFAEELNETPDDYIGIIKEVSRMHNVCFAVRSMSRLSRKQIMIDKLYRSGTKVKTLPLPVVGKPGYISTKTKNGLIHLDNKSEAVEATKKLQEKLNVVIPAGSLPLDHCPRLDFRPALLTLGAIRRVANSRDHRGCVKVITITRPTGFARRAESESHSFIAVMNKEHNHERLFYMYPFLNDDNTPYKYTGHHDIIDYDSIDMDLLERKIGEIFSDSYLNSLKPGVGVVPFKVQEFLGLRNFASFPDNTLLFETVKFIKTPDNSGFLGKVFYITYLETYPKYKYMVTSDIDLIGVYPHINRPEEVLSEHHATKNLDYDIDPLYIGGLCSNTELNCLKEINRLSEREGLIPPMKHGGITRFTTSSSVLWPFLYDHILITTPSGDSFLCRTPTEYSILSRILALNGYLVTFPADKYLYERNQHEILGLSSIYPLLSPLDSSGRPLKSGDAQVKDIYAQARYIYECAYSKHVTETYFPLQMPLHSRR